MLFDVPKFREGSFAWRCARFFVNNINWCEGYYYETSDSKPENKIYNFFYNNWLFPFKQNGCICCNTTRGLFYGVVIGYILGVA